MSFVYSRRFVGVQQALSGSWVDLYTVPAGYLALVKYVGYVNDSSATIDLKVGRNSSQQLLRINALAPGASGFWLPFLAFSAGEHISVLGNAGTITLEVHGYLLVL